MKFPNMRASTLSLLILLLTSAPAVAVGQTAKKTAKPAAGTSERWLPALRSRADFDRLARVYTDQPYALPHVIFVIDRKDGNKIYYANSRRYRFHVDFVNGNYLSLERGDVFFKNNYVSENRRFILGTLAWQAPVKRYTFEYWEGDTASAALISLTADVIKKTFFDPV